ncbi:hypothetical protein GCM10027031_06380 [Corynebacterium atrinae]
MDGAGGEPIAAGFVAGERSGVDEHDLVPSLRGVNRSCGARRARADNKDVTVNHAPHCGMSPHPGVWRAATLDYG